MPAALPDHRRPLASRAEVEAVLGRIGQTMDALNHLVEAETALIRKGKLADAGALQADKLELARRYVADMQTVQANAAAVKALAPERVAALTLAHDGFRAHLALNMTVLATAKALAESIVQEIAGVAARQDIPVAYGAKGSTPPPAPKTTKPIAVDRSF